MDVFDARVYGFRRRPDCRRSRSAGMPQAGLGPARSSPWPPDGRLFRGTRGGPLSESVYGRTWHTRDAALSPALATTRPGPAAIRPATRCSRCD